MDVTITADTLRRIAEIISHEAVVLSPYKDSVGVWTIGVGHTANAGGLNPATFKGKLTLEQALELFQNDLAKFEKRVKKAFTRPLAQHEFDAAVSFDFNTGAIDRATWVKSFNAGNRDLAVKQIMAWNKPKEIISRRKKEQLLFDKGHYSCDGMATVYEASPSGQVLWKTAKRVKLPSLVSQKAPEVIDKPLNVSPIQEKPIASMPPLPTTQKPVKAGPVAAIVGAMVAAAYAVSQYWCDYIGLFCN